MNNVRIIRADWYHGIIRTTDGPQLAYQDDHLSNMVMFDNAPALSNYYLLVNMKTNDAADPISLPAIMLDGPYWLIPNYYTHIVQMITFQVCCKTDGGDFEKHSAKFTGSILPTIKHNGEPIDQSPMFDPYMDAVDKKFEKLVAISGDVVIDGGLSIEGAAADAKAAGEAVADLNERLEQVEGGGTDGLTEEIKSALLACFRNVAWEGADPTGQSYIDALQTALYPPANLTSITAVYSGGSVSENDTLDRLRANLVVTAYYADSTSEVVTDYTLSGTLAEGTSTITVRYNGKATTFTVTVVGVLYEISLANNDFLALDYAGAGSSVYGAGLSTAPSVIHKRRAFITDVSNGLAPFKVTSDDTTFTDTIYYPIKVPARATGVTVTITPNNQYVAIDILQYADGKYTKVVGSGWNQKTATLAFDAASDNHIACFSKVNSGGSTAYTDANKPTDFVIKYTTPEDET